jgi:WD40 repeat protein
VKTEPVLILGELHMLYLRRQQPQKKALGNRHPSELESASSSMQNYLVGHQAAVLSLDTSHIASTGHLLSSSEDGTARLWDFEQKKTVKCFRSPLSVGLHVSDQPLNCIKWIDEHLAALSCDRNILLIDDRSPMLIQSLSSPSQCCSEAEINMLALPILGPAASVDHLFFINDDGVIGEWDIRQQRCTRLSKSGHRSCGTCLLASSPSTCYSGGTDSQVIQWEVDALQPVATQDMSVAAASSPQVVNPPFVHDLLMADDTLCCALGDGTLGLMRRRGSSSKKNSKQWRLRPLHSPNVLATLTHHPTSAGGLLLTAANDLQGYMVSLQDMWEGIDVEKSQNHQVFSLRAPTNALGTVSGGETEAGELRGILVADTTSSIGWLPLPDTKSL